MRTKPEGDWVDGKSSVVEPEAKPVMLEPGVGHDNERGLTAGVKITIDREIGYDPYDASHQK
jgi:hypothetical protein